MLIFVENRRKSFFTMIQKAQYQEPQSEIILLSATVLLTGSPDIPSGGSETMGSEQGSWAPYDI